MGDLEPVILGIVSKLTAGGDATLAKQNTIIADIVAAQAVIDETNGYLEVGGDIHDVLYADAVGASIAVDIAAIPTVMVGTDSAALAATALTIATWTNARAAFLDEAISAAKTLTVAERTAIRKSVCLTGDTASSIGKILFDLNARLTLSRAGYLDELDFDLQAAIAAIPTVMVGTDSAALAAEWTAALATILGNFSAARIGYLDELAAANLPADVDAVKAKTDLLNSAAGTSTLNDANTSDTIIPSSLPCKMHVVFDISTIIVAGDDFTLEVKVGAAASERVVAYYKLTSDGSDITADTGSGIGNKIKVRRIDISGVLVYTGEQVLLNYTKNSVTDRNVLYRYVCGV